MMEEPQQPEDDAPEEGVPGEPGEATPSEAAPEEQPVHEETPAGSGEEHPGPEIEGMEELAQAAGEAGAPAAEEPAAEAEAPAAEEPAAEADADAAEEPAAEEAPSAERPRPGARRRQEEKGGGDEVIPGAHLEPDLVLEEQRPAEGEFGEYAEYADKESGEGEPDAAAEEASTEEQPAALTPLDLAADARYRATGKRKSAVARVIAQAGRGHLHDQRASSRRVLPPRPPAAHGPPAA